MTKREYDYDTMQYCLWKPRDVSFLLDASEWDYIDKYFTEGVEKEIASEDKNTERLLVALGTYKYQREYKNGYILSPTLFHDYKGFGHITLTDRGWEVLELLDVIDYESTENQYDVPVAALFRTSVIAPNIAENDVPLTVFVKYDGMAVVDNLLNRPGLFSLKHFIEAENVGIENWSSLFSKEDVLKAHLYHWHEFKDEIDQQ